MTHHCVLHVAVADNDDANSINIFPNIKNKNLYITVVKDNKKTSKPTRKGLQK